MKIPRFTGSGRHGMCQRQEDGRYLLVLRQPTGSGIEDPPHMYFDTMEQCDRVGDHFIITGSLEPERANDTGFHWPPSEEL